MVLSEVYLVAGPVNSFDRKRAIESMRKRKHDAIVSAVTTEMTMQQFEIEHGADGEKKDKDAAAGLGLALGKGGGIGLTILDNIQVGCARPGSPAANMASQKGSCAVRDGSVARQGSHACIRDPKACSYSPTLPVLHRSTSPTFTCVTKTTRRKRRACTQQSAAPWRS